jgi:hypothetical protein
MNCDSESFIAVRGFSLPFYWSRRTAPDKSKRDREKLSVGTKYVESWQDAG